jgi:hypothetical protein
MNLHLVLAATLLLAPFPFASRTTQLASPDRALRALVSPSGPKTSESRVVVRTAAGRELARRDFRSDDGEHGFAVAAIEWTPDGRFLVFAVTSSGGHQPWHWPTFAFSRRTGEFYALDDVVGPITSQFRLAGGGRVALKRMDAMSGRDDLPVTLDLTHLDRAHSAGRPN